jgi:hypothetical protein
MPIYRIIQSNSNRTAACIQSTFSAPSDQEAFKKINKYNDLFEYMFSYLWLEKYNDTTDSYEIIKNVTNPPQLK